MQTRSSSTRKRLAQALVVTAFGFAPTELALAQTDAPARAFALFQQGEGLAASGDSAAACRMFHHSYSLDARLDSLLRWADCLESDGKVASAYAALRDAVELGRRSADARWIAADARARALRPRLSYLTLDVPEPQALPGLVVERDGFRIGSSAWGIPVPIDPGRHAIHVSAPGYRGWATSVEIHADGTALYVEVPQLERSPDAIEPMDRLTTDDVPSPPDTRRAAPPPNRASEAQLGPLRLAVLSLGGVGLLGLGAGWYFSAETEATLASRDGICPSGKDCEPGTNQRLADLTRQARHSQRIGIVCSVLGGAALVSGAGLWLASLPKAGAAPRSTVIAPLVQPGAGGLLVQGKL